MTGILASPAALTTADRCDRCGAAAMVRAVLPTGGELLFCGHHANEHSTRLEQMAAVLHHARPTHASTFHSPSRHHRASPVGCGSGGPSSPIHHSNDRGRSVLTDRNWSVVVGRW